MEYLLSDYKGSKYFREYLKATKTDKRAFESKPESEQLSQLKEWFSANNIKVRSKRKSSTPAATLSIDSLYTELVNKSTEENAVETLRKLKELETLKKMANEIAKKESEIEAEKAKLEALKTKYDETLAKYAK